MNNTTQERISFNNCDVLKITQIIDNGPYKQIPCYTYIILGKHKNRKTANQPHKMGNAICVSIIGDPKLSVNPIEQQQRPNDSQLRITVTPVNASDLTFDDLNDMMIRSITSDFMSSKVLYTKQHKILFQRYLEKFQEPILTQIIEYFDLIRKFAYDLNNEYSQNDLCTMIHKFDEVVGNTIAQLTNDNPYIDVESMCHGFCGEMITSPIMIEDVQLRHNGRAIVRFHVQPCMLNHIHDPRSIHQRVSDPMGSAIATNRIMCGIVDISYVDDSKDVSIVPLELNGVWKFDIDGEQNEPLKLVLKDIFDEVVIDNQEQRQELWFTDVMRLFVSTIEKKLHNSYRTFGAIWSGYGSFGQPNNTGFYSVHPDGRREPYGSATINTTEKK